MSGTAWTEYGIPIKIVADERGTDNVVVPTADVTAIKAKTDQLAFSISGQVDANTLTGGLSEAGVRSAVGLASANLDTQLADIPTVSEFNARTLVASAYFDASTDLVTVGASNDKTGYSLVVTPPTSLEVADAVWDEILTGATHNVPTSAGRRLRQVADVGVYEGGQVWIDTVNGTSGTADYENGTVDLPSDNIADATTLANSVGITRFKIAPNSSFTLASSYTGFNFSGDGKWTLGLGGQDINKTTFIHATVSGTCTSSDRPHFENCEVGTVTLPPCEILDSRLTSTITMSNAGTYSLDRCVSGVAGTSSPVIDFGSSVGSCSLNMRHYSGGVQILNMGQSGTDNMSLEGNGALTIDSSCTGGIIALRGNFKVTDNSGGAVTIVRDDNSTGISEIPTAAEIATQVLAAGDVDGYSLEETLKICLAALAGKISGAGTGSITIRAADDTKNRIVATTDKFGNRLSITIDEDD